MLAKPFKLMTDLSMEDCTVRLNKLYEPFQGLFSTSTSVSIEGSGYTQARTVSIQIDRLARDRRTLSPQTLVYLIGSMSSSAGQKTTFRGHVELGEGYFQGAIGLSIGCVVSFFAIFAGGFAGLVLFGLAITAGLFWWSGSLAQRDVLLKKVTKAIEGQDSPN